MSDTHKFQDSEKRFHLSVKTEFLTKCPNPSEHTVFDLNSKFFMFNYLHSPSGPAVHRLKDDRTEYWVNGVLLNVEDKPLATKMEHDYKYKEQLVNIINEE